MKPGSFVRLSAYEEEIVRRVVEVEGDSVAVCNDAEWKAAKREGRDPVAVRFKLTDVIDQSSASA